MIGGKGVGSRDYDRNFDTRGHESGGIVCHYCHKPRHMKHDCKKLQNKKTVCSSTNDISEQSISAKNH